MLNVEAHASRFLCFNNEGIHHVSEVDLVVKYEDYLKWYETARRSIFDPALSIAIRLIEDLLDQHIDEVDRGRFRISTSRVKSAQRSFAKLNRPKYQHRFTDYDSVPDILDDFVGIRLVCNNLSDINRLKEVFGELPVQDGSISGLAVEEESQRDYFSNPKPSGYRAYHVNLVVPVAQMNESRDVRVEIQARTLLQDG